MKVVYGKSIGAVLALVLALGGGLLSAGCGDEDDDGTGGTGVAGMGGTAGIGSGGTAGIGSGGTAGIGSGGTAGVGSGGTAGIGSGGIGGSPTTPCTGCTTGEACVDVAGQGTCQCNPANDTCGVGFECDASTLRCTKEGLSCAPVCRTGETCVDDGAGSGVCECGPTTCPVGQSCNAESRCEADAAAVEEFARCTTAGEVSGTLTCADTGGASPIWLHPCTDSSACPNPLTVCLSQLTGNQFNYCFYNYCDADWESNWDPNNENETDSNGVVWGACDTDAGLTSTPGSGTGTCLPLPDGSGGIIHICSVGGTSIEGGTCAQDAVRSDADRLCSTGNLCLGFGVSACTVDRDCGTTGKCNAGVCYDACATDNDCFGAETCMAGACAVACATQDDCSAATTCTAGACVPNTCTDDASCGEGNYCNADGLCQGLNRCYDLCNAGTGDKTGAAGCADPAAQGADGCINVAGTRNKPSATELGACFAGCTMFDPAACPDHNGPRSCFPNFADASLDGSCIPQTATPAPVGDACTGTVPNPCVDEAICFAPTEGAAEACWQWCNCTGGYDAQGLCIGGAACPTDHVCAAAGGGTPIGFCAPAPETP